MSSFLSKKLDILNFDGMVVTSQKVCEVTTCELFTFSILNTSRGLGVIVVPKWWENPSCPNSSVNAFSNFSSVNFIYFEASCVLKNERILSLKIVSLSSISSLTQSFLWYLLKSTTQAIFDMLYFCFFTPKYPLPA